MTHEEFVKSIWPQASCFKTKLYWPGQGDREAFIVTRAPHWSGVDGEGDTEKEAWATAAEISGVLKFYNDLREQFARLDGLAGIRQSHN